MNTIENIKQLSDSEKEYLLFEELDNDFEQFPLPICFDEREELKELNLRRDKIMRRVSSLLTERERIK